jgi:hypothetical protein
MPASGFRLDHDQRKDLRPCLQDENVTLLEPTDRFSERIEGSINHYLRSKPEETFRAAHDALRALWKCCRLDPPPIQVLRKEVRKLPRPALQYMGRRARVVIPTLFPGESIEDSVSDPSDRLADRFLVWTAAADDQKLVKALSVLASDSERVVPGRSRGHGKRSRSRLEPVILGETRGAGSRVDRGGPPRDERQPVLVRHLAGDWLRATGEMPGKSRSVGSGFGKLVRLVFEWILVPIDASQEAIDAAIDDATEIASYRLRQFWEEVEQGRSIPPLEDFLRRRGEQ